MTISKPYHSENRTIWYVYAGDGDCLTTLEIGQKYRSNISEIWELREVIWHTGYVKVKRKNSDFLHIWSIDSLLASHMIRV